jgi:hypothetical protein
MLTLILSRPRDGRDSLLDAPRRRLPGRREPREKLSVTLEPTVIGGVKTFVLTPKEIPRSIGPVKL